MTPTPSPNAPWLAALIVCPLRADGEAVRKVLHARGLRDRSVPAGAAKAAWTCALPREALLGVVVSGAGRKGALATAGQWGGRARRIVLCGAGEGSGLLPAGTVVLDGDPDMARHAATARLAAPEHGGTPAKPGTGAHHHGTPIPTAPGRIASVDTPVETEAARQSLAATGIAAVDGEADTWREAVHSTGALLLITRGLAEHVDVPARLHTLTPPGEAGRSAWRVVLDIGLHPADRAVLRQVDAALAVAREGAAAVAVAAALGAV